MTTLQMEFLPQTIPIKKQEKLNILELRKSEFNYSKINRKMKHLNQKINLLETTNLGP